MCTFPDSPWPFGQQLPYVVTTNHPRFNCVHRLKITQCCSSEAPYRVGGLGLGLGLWVPAYMYILPATGGRGEMPIKDENSQALLFWAAMMFLPDGGWVVSYTPPLVAPNPGHASLISGKLHICRGPLGE